MFMSYFKKVVWIVCCLFIFGGCATMHQQNGKTASAAGSVSDEIDLTGDASAMYQLGRSHQENKSYAEAIDAYEKALALDPDSYKIYNAMGVVYSLQGEHELAVELIKEAIRLAPLASHLYNNLGYAFLQQGSANKAADAFERALMLDPENLHARRNLAASYRKMGCDGNQPCGRWQDPQAQMKLEKP
jgi:Tfp pilus assembly protein PilF